MKKTIYLLASVILLLSCKKESSNPTTTTTTTPNTAIAKYGNGVTDIEGRKYKTVIIGTQEWMGENLKTTKFNDNTPIAYLGGTNEYYWSMTKLPAWCYPGDNKMFDSIYGKLYNAYTIYNSADNNVCPINWHVPTVQDWKTLVDYLGGVNVAGGKMKEAGDMRWKKTKSIITNQSLFTSVPSGDRSGGGSFHSPTDGKLCAWWSKTDTTTTKTYDGAWILYNYSDTAATNFFYAGKSSGFSIRCIKN
jgi:uncharacterized protein (TIGR02145 family)